MACQRRWRKLAGTMRSKSKVCWCILARRKEFISQSLIRLCAHVACCLSATRVTWLPALASHPVLLQERPRRSGGGCRN